MTTQQEQFIACRTYSHAWEDYEPPDMRAPLFGWRLTLRCVRCGMLRHDIVTQDGRLLQRHYTQPIGYKWAKDERLSKDQVRALYYRTTRNPRKKKPPTQLGVSTVGRGKRKPT